MKTSVLAFNCLLFCFAYPALSQKNDMEAIKAVVDRETKAFIEIDYATWADCWVQAPYAFWSFADTTDVNSFSGWDEIDKAFRAYFKTKPPKASIERTWHDIKVFGNGAYARFTQFVKDGRPPQAQLRVLEKVKGQWKIVCVTVIALEKENVPKL